MPASPSTQMRVGLGGAGGRGGDEEVVGVVARLLGGGGADRVVVAGVGGQAGHPHLVFGGDGGVVGDRGQAALGGAVADAAVGGGAGPPAHGDGAWPTSSAGTGRGWSGPGRAPAEPAVSGQSARSGQRGDEVTDHGRPPAGRARAKGAQQPLLQRQRCRGRDCRRRGQGGHAPPAPAARVRAGLGGAGPRRSSTSARRASHMSWRPAARGLAIDARAARGR